ncbi:MAG: hypothetical protein H7A00_02470 [Hahellaceae bacterium]|nr:hypothetical protein [Hahellaceae bacterium]
MSRNSLIYASIMLAFSISSFEVRAEKFFSWIDEFGQRHTTVIPEEANPLLDKKQVEDLKSQPAKQPDETKEASINHSEPLSTPERDSSTAEDKPVHLDSAPALVDDSLAEPVTPSVAKTKESGAYRALNGEEYIDANVLEANGFVRGEGDLPYYLWRDSDGVSHYSFYKPKNAAQRSASDVATVIKTTPADELSGEAVASTDNSQLDEFAKKLLKMGADSSEFKKFSEGCCANINSEPLLSLMDGQLFGMLDDDSEIFEFSDGSSPYLLVRLPVSQREYHIIIRSFIKSDRKKGLINGVFVPQISMLDEHYKPVRLIRRAAYHIQPETWLKYGFLEGIFKIPAKGVERYMLVHTSNELVQGETRIEGKTVQVLSHERVGEIEIELVRE